MDGFEISESYPSIDGPVAIATFNRQAAIRSLGDSPDLGNYTCIITGDFADGNKFVAQATISLVQGANIGGNVIGPSGGLQGVPIDLYDSGGELYGTTVTDASGHYNFEGVVPGDYIASIVPPLGYLSDSDEQEITVQSSDITVDFHLARTEMMGQQRGLGFWKHQPTVYLTGRGKADIQKATFCRFLNNIRVHFNENRSNPIIIYDVTQPANQRDSLVAVSNLLSPDEPAAVNTRARQHLMALLLNVASSKLPQWAKISRDSATVSQAITYCYSLIMDGNESNDELAKDIAETINNAMRVSAGVIPLNTPNISYKPETGGDEELPTSFELSQNYPNPFNGQTTIQFELPTASHVIIEVYDILGRRIATILDEDRPAGCHQITWNAGNQSSGMYFYKIQAGDFTETRKMLLMK
jgi:hypothetical protein